MSQRYVPTRAQASNAVEALALQSIGNPQHVVMAELSLTSAARDLDSLFAIPELEWPTKEVLVKSQVTYPIRDKMVTDTVNRVHRVPMTPEEASAYFQARVNAAAVELGVEPPTVTVKKSTSKVKEQKKNVATGRKPAAATTPGASGKSGCKGRGGKGKGGK